jgi:hypothetical protein
LAPRQRSFKNDPAYDEKTGLCISDLKVKLRHVRQVSQEEAEKYQKDIEEDPETNPPSEEKEESYKRPSPEGDGFAPVLPSSKG